MSGNRRRRFPGLRVVAALVLGLGLRPSAARAQSFTLRPTSASVVIEDLGGCAGPVIVRNESRAWDGNAQTYATVRVDAATGVVGTDARCLGSTTLLEPTNDLSILWSGFQEVSGGGPPVIFVSPSDTISISVDVIQADADVQPATLINEYNVLAGVLPSDVKPLVTSEWRLDALLSLDTNTTFHDDAELDFCDGVRELSPDPNLPCGTYFLDDGPSSGVATFTSVNLLPDMISSAQVSVSAVTDPAPANAGTATLTLLTANVNAPEELWTVTYNGTDWDVVGSVTGALANAPVTGAYDNGRVAFTLGGAPVLNDDFEFDVFTNAFILTTQTAVRVRTQHNSAIGAPAPYTSAFLDPVPANTATGGGVTFGTIGAGAIAQTWTLLCIDISTVDSELWSVTGSLTGLEAASATTGVAFTTGAGTVQFTVDTVTTPDYALADDFQFDIERESTLKISDVRLEVFHVPGGSIPGLALSGTFPPALPSILKNNPITGTTGAAVGDLMIDATGTTPGTGFTWNDHLSLPPPQANAPVSGAASLPLGTTGQTVTGPTPENPDWEIIGTAAGNPTGEPGVVGSHWFNVKVTDQAVPALSVSSSYQLIVDGTDIAPRTLPALRAGEAFSVTFGVVDSDVGGARGGVASYDWSVAAAVLDGLTFTPALPATNVPSVTLSGTPTGVSAVSFTLTVDDSFAFGLAEEIAAFQDTVTFTGSSLFRVIDQALPPVVQGMLYDNSAAEFPYLATLQAVRATAFPILPAGWTVTDPTSGTLPPTGGNLELVTATATTIGDSGRVSIGTLTGNFPVAASADDDELAGRQTFTIQVADASAPTQTTTRDFEFEVLPRRTDILAQPPVITDSSVLTFTVFATGGVPTKGTALGPGTEFRDGVIGQPRYTLEYRVDPEILPGDDPDNDDDAGTFMGTPPGGHADTDYNADWLPWTDFPITAWPAYTTPGIISIDLENDLAIAEPVPPLRPMKPSARSGRRYRVRFRASDGVFRAVDGLATTDMAETEVVITVVDPAGTDTNPEPTRPTRLRQERF